VRHGLHKLLDLTFAEPQPATTTKTNAIVVVHHGRIVAERYAEGVTRDDTQPSWSMAKSVLHAAVGVLVRDGRIDVNARAAVPEWQGADDPRRDITVDALLHMTPGLAFREDYVNDGVSDVIQMLFRPGYDDTGGFAASFPQIRPVDDVSNYSSGTTNIISRVVRDIVGRDEAYHDFLRRELLQPTGMTTAMPRFDKAGTWIASSYCFATPRDFARFGLLYLRDGVWDGRRILPEGWVDYARSPAPAQPRDTPLGYGAHWWLLRDDLGTFSANGYQGQHILVVPALDLVVVRNGDTPVERRPYLLDLLRMIVNCFRDT
jgi:CubicO group peptidase (beta-lactamase class C family)